ncbi:MAG: YrdB family protein [Devosia sp.]
MASLKAGNLLLAFALEVALLIALSLFGWVRGGDGGLRYGLAVGLPVLAIFLWGVLAAPRSARRLEMPGLIVFKAAMFAAGTLAFWGAGQNFIGAIFGTLAAVHLLASLAFKQVSVSAVGRGYPSPGPSDHPLPKGGEGKRRKATARSPAGSSARRR